MWFYRFIEVQSHCAENLIQNIHENISNNIFRYWFSFCRIRRDISVSDSSHARARLHLAFIAENHQMKCSCTGKSVYKTIEDGRKNGMQPKGGRRGTKSSKTEANGKNSFAMNFYWNILASALCKCIATNAKNSEIKSSFHCTSKFFFSLAHAVHMFEFPAHENIPVVFFWAAAKFHITSVTPTIFCIATNAQ